MKTSITSFLITLFVVMSSFVQSPFASIVSPVAASYSTYQIKITYTDIQTRLHRTLLLFGTGRSPALSELTPYSTSSISYSNDCVPPITLGLAGSTIKKFVDALNLKPNLKVSGGSNRPVISLMIQKGIAPAEMVFEHLADEGDAFAILNLLEGSLMTETATVKSEIKKFRNYTIGYN